MESAQVTVWQRMTVAERQCVLAILVEMLLKQIQKEEVRDEKREQD